MTNCEVKILAIKYLSQLQEIYKIGTNYPNSELQFVISCLIEELPTEESEVDNGNKP